MLPSRFWASTTSANATPVSATQAFGSAFPLARAAPVIAAIKHSGGITTTNKLLCCTNRARDSLFESSMISGRHKQLNPYEVLEHELVGLH